MRPLDNAVPWQLRLPFFYGWIVVGIGFLASVFSVGLTWAAGLLAVPMGAELGWSRSAFFFAVSMRGWIGIVVTPFLGPYLDRPNGPRLLTLFGGVLNTVTLLFIPFMTSEWQFLLLFGILGGIAQTAQGGITAAIVPKWFVQLRGTAITISTLGGAVAAVALPPLVAALAGGAGWRGAWMAIGILAFAFGTLPALLLKRQPEDLGLHPDGRAPSPVAAGGRATSLSSTVAEGRGSSPSPLVGEGGRSRRVEAPNFTLNEATRTSAFWVLMVGIAIGSLANNGLPASLAPIFVDRGFSFDLAASTLVAYGVASILTKFVFGWVTNHYSLRWVLLGLTVYGTVALPSILVFPSEVSPLLWGFLIGAYIGAYFPLSQMVWAEYFGRAHSGAISALGRPLGLTLGASGPFLLAFTRDLTGSYDLGIAPNALSAALCFVCLVAVRPIRATRSSATVSEPSR